MKKIAEKKTKINEKFTDIENIAHPQIKAVIKEHLLQFKNNTSIAFASKTLKKNPIKYNNQEVKEVLLYEEACTKRVPITENFTSAQIEKITDERIKTIIKERINEKGGKIKEAFVNLKENPLWLNKEKGIRIKSVTVYDESKVEKIRNGYVKTGGNHHALIYKDENGKYNDKVISLWEAVEIGKLNISQTGKPYPIISVIDNPELGKFQFSMQINDLFVFDLKHSENPIEDEINFLDPKNRFLISKKLFRVQKISKNNAGVFQTDFRHHLETTVNRTENQLRGITWERFQSNDHLKRITKLRINHLGDIIKVGE